MLIASQPSSPASFRVENPSSPSRSISAVAAASIRSFDSFSRGGRGFPPDHALPACCLPDRFNALSSVPRSAPANVIASIPNLTPEGLTSYIVRVTSRLSLTS
jgi:hypothetical protein